jgi:hypothetical protein
VDPKEAEADARDDGNELDFSDLYGLARRGRLVANVEKILERRPEEAEHHDIVITLCAEPSYRRDTHATAKGFVDLVLVFKLRVMFALDELELDGNLLTGNDVVPRLVVECASKMGQCCSQINAKRNQKGLS